MASLAARYRTRSLRRLAAASHIGALVCTIAVSQGCKLEVVATPCNTHEDCVQTEGENCMRCVGNGEGSVCEAQPETVYPADCVDVGGSSSSEGTSGSSSSSSSGDPTTSPVTEPTTEPPPSSTEPPPTSDSETADSSSSGGGGTGLCGTDHTEGSPLIDGCVGELCCAELEACTGDPTCAACLAEDPPGKDCIEQPAYGDYQACVFFGCPPALCNSDIVIPDRNGDPSFECHACMFQPCCGDVAFCVQDPDGCEACLAEEDPLVPQSAECQAAPLQIQQGAALVQECAAANCADVCPL
jgi:hypothetical protein